MDKELCLTAASAGNVNNRESDDIVFSKTQNYMFHSTFISKKQSKIIKNSLKRI